MQGSDAFEYNVTLSLSLKFGTTRPPAWSADLNILPFKPATADPKITNLSAEITYKINGFAWIVDWFLLKVQFGTMFEF